MSDVQRQDCEGKGALIAWQAKVGAESSAERAVRLETERQGIVGVFLRFDCSVRREFGASGEVDRCAGICGSSHFGFVPSGNTSRRVEGLEQGKTKRDRQECLSYSRAKVLALLAALVSAFVFSVLF